MHVQLAIFLQAETKKWAVQFCRALHRGHPDLRAAWSLLQAENDHTVSVVISAHPLLNDQSAPLDHVLRELPPWLRCPLCIKGRRMAGWRDRPTGI